jgi:hypothetical protein
MVEPANDTLCAEQTEYRLLDHRICLLGRYFDRQTAPRAERPAAEMPRQWVGAPTLNLRRELGSPISRVVRTGSSSGHLARATL